MADIAVFILTYNERLHIERCIRSVMPFAAQVFVVDCGSDDGTVDIAQQLGASVVHHAWENNHAFQTNWAIDNLPFSTAWVMRIDADEIVTEPLAREINDKLPTLSADIGGLILKRRQIFLGRFLRWGGNYPIRLLRGWRRGYGRCEDRWMDEHLVIANGRTLELIHDLEDRNLNDLRWWTNKQANYAVREVADTLLAQEQLETVAAPYDPSSRRKRWIKVHLYRRMPRFVRPLAYFLYRYFLRFGWLDGVPGLIWHVLQGFWYRYLVDAISYEVEHLAAATHVSPLMVIEDVYKLRVQSTRQARTTHDSDQA